MLCAPSILWPETQRQRERERDGLTVERVYWAAILTLFYVIVLLLFSAIIVRRFGLGGYGPQQGQGQQGGNWQGSSDAKGCQQHCLAVVGCSPNSVSTLRGSYGKGKGPGLDQGASSS